MFYPTWVDVAVFVGSIGLFFTLFLLFLRVLPSIAIAEVKLLLKTSSEQSKMQLIKEGHQDKVHVDEYVESLEKFDSVKQEEYAKI
jgi:molybdopterin-containing oxidoreductase family membrane subunit